MYSNNKSNPTNGKTIIIITTTITTTMTDHVIEARRPDLVVVDKKVKSCKIIDFAVPGDSRIEDKEKDKIEKFQDSGRELQKIWNLKVKSYH